MVAQLCLTLCDPMDCSPPGSPAKYWLDEARIFWIHAAKIKIGIKIAVRNINNLRYADGTTLMAESEEELKSFMMKVKEKREKFGLKLKVQKTNIMASGPITSW